MQLGPFELHEVIGRGGMGEVWAARHAETHVPVAVKLDLHPPTEQLRQAFFHEVRLVAGLDSPSCVQVIDAGVTTAAEVAGSSGRLKGGAPWLAMELALGGTLSRKRGPQTWAELRHVLLGLLDGLRHAHSRGVLHRDIKYGNLLLAGPPGDLTTRPATIGEARVVLSDFGIGHLLTEHSSDGDDAAGTPLYMAPEQILGRWRDQGPWTDFYAVGVLAWCMATGNYPFTGKSSIQVLHAHLKKQVGPFEPVLPVPDGFEALCRTLLKKKPGERFQFATQVHRAIVELGEAAGRAQPTAVDEDAPTLVSSRPSERPTLTERTGTDARISLGLWGLKPLPLVGRDKEMHRLREALQEVARTGRAGAIVLEGAAGVGKSRLVRSLGEWAHEQGLADSLTAVHTPLREPGDGLLAMVRRHLRLDGLTPREVEARIRATLGDTPRAENLIRAVAGQRLPRVELNRTLAVALANDLPGRARIVVVEDVQWGLETLVAVDAALEDQDARPAPLLFVLTARSEALQERPAEQELLEQITQERSLPSFRVDPLDEAAHRTLVRSLLGLEGSLAAAIEERTAGNPLFAVQWVDHWVEQGKLIRGSGGLTLADPTTLEIPKNLLSVWTDRVQAALKGRGPHDGAALELAAMLGQQLDPDEWRTACDQADLQPSDRLLDELLRRRLLISTDERRPNRLSFSHGLLVEALHERARNNRRWKTLNRAAAQALAPAGGDPIRLARLWLEAGETARAIEPLGRACQAQLMAYDMRSDVRIRQLQDALEAVDPEVQDPQWVHLWIAQSWRARLRGNLDLAQQIAHTAVDRSAEGPLQPMHFEALKELGMVDLARADLESALDHLGRAGNLALDVGRVEFASYCLMQQADALMFLGRVEQARGIYREIRDVFENGSAEILSHEPVLGLANASLRLGDTAEAAVQLEEARRRAQREHLPGAMATIANLQGELARMTGDLGSAVECYSEAARRYRELEHAHFVWPALNLGMVLFAQRKYAEARAQMRVLLGQLGSAMPVGEACARFVDYASACALAQWEDVDAGHQWLAAFFENTPLIERDLATLASAAASACRAANRPRRERAALELLVFQLGQLGPEADLAAARARIQTLAG